MRNNKKEIGGSLLVGSHVKVKLPASWANHSGQKYRNKKHSWWKAKIAEVYNNGSYLLIVYPAGFIGRMFCGTKDTVVKCL